MARPAKATKTMAKNLTAAERAARLETEEALRGKGGALQPPAYLSDEQQEVFRFIVAELAESGILGNLDVYILAAAAVAIDRLASMEENINAAPELLFDSTYMVSREKYSRDFYRCCNGRLTPAPRRVCRLAYSAACGRKILPGMARLAGGHKNGARKPFLG